MTCPFLYDDIAAPLVHSSPYQPQSMPSTVVLGEEGRVGVRVCGEIPSALTLERVVDGARTDG